MMVVTEGDGRFTDAQRHWLDVIKNYVPLAVAKRVFGQDPKPIIACPPEPWRRREELNEVLVA